MTRTAFTQAELEYARDINDNLPGALFAAYADGKGGGSIFYVNKVLLDLFECSSCDELMALCGGTAAGMIYPDDRTKALRSIQTRSMNFSKNTGGDSASGEDPLIKNIVGTHYRIQTKTGRIITVFNNIRYSRRPDGRLAAYCVLIPSEYNADAIERDPVTGLLTLRDFLHEADRLSREGKLKGRAAYIYFNITNFKRFNMLHGINAGDEYLRKISDILKYCFREDSLIARMAADHFAVLTTRPDYRDAVDEAHQLSARIFSGTTAELKAGVYESDSKKNPVSPVEASDLAKIACDKIQSTAGRYVQIYDQAIVEEIKKKIYISENLDTAIAKGYIQVYYQPVIRSISKTLCGFEALSRWIDPKYGRISPGEFIPVLEESHLIHKLDIFVLEQICRKINAEREAGRTMVPVSFNLSRVDFLTNDVFNEVEKIVSSYGTPRDMIRIEVTESAIMQDREHMKAVIRQFRAAGYQVWMDDFGSGYSSLNMLKDIRFDEIKLDMEFLSNFSKTSREIIASTVRMSKRLHIRTLAEGVETREQAEFLRQIGCEKMQGYYFGRPAPFERSMARIHEELNIQSENRACHNYLGQISSADLQTEQAITIFSLSDSGKLHFYFTNEHCSNIVKGIGFHSVEQLVKKSKADHYPAYQKLRQFMRMTDWNNSVNENHAYYTSLKGHYYRIDFRKIAELDDNRTFIADVCDLTNNKDCEAGKRMDMALRSILNDYDSVYIIHFDKDYVDVVYQGRGEDDLPGARYYNLRKNSEYFAENCLDKADLERYREYINPDTLDERIKKSDNGCLLCPFRVRNADGRFSWRLFSLCLLPESGENVGMLSIRNSILENRTDALGIYKEEYEKK